MPERILPLSPCVRYCCCVNFAARDAAPEDGPNESSLRAEIQFPRHAGSPFLRQRLCGLTPRECAARSVGTYSRRASLEVQRNKLYGKRTGISEHPSVSSNGISPGIPVHSTTVSAPLAQSRTLYPRQAASQLRNLPISTRQCRSKQKLDRRIRCDEVVLERRQLHNEALCTSFCPGYLGRRCQPRIPIPL